MAYDCAQLGAQLSIVVHNKQLCTARAQLSILWTTVHNCARLAVHRRTSVPNCAAPRPLVEGPSERALGGGRPAITRARCACSIGHACASVHGCACTIGHACAYVHGCACTIGHACACVHGRACAIGHACASVHGCACTIGHACASVHGSACTIGHGCASVEYLARKLLRRSMMRKPPPRNHFCPKHTRY